MAGNTSHGHAPTALFAWEAHNEASWLREGGLGRFNRDGWIPFVSRLDPTSARRYVVRKVIRRSQANRICHVHPGLFNDPSESPLTTFVSRIIVQSNGAQMSAAIA